MPTACDKCRDNLALLVEPKNSAGDAGALGRAAEAAAGTAARPGTPLLGAYERRELEAHVASCPRCARELALLRAVVLELQTLPIAAAPAELRERIRREITATARPGSVLASGSPPSRWFEGWLAFFRSPSRMAWASGMAMAAFALIMLRDQPLSQREPAVTTGPGLTQPAPAPGAGNRPVPAPRAAPPVQRAPQRAADSESTRGVEAVPRASVDRTPRPVPGAGPGASPSRDNAAAPRPRRTDGLQAARTERRKPAAAQASPQRGSAAPAPQRTAPPPQGAPPAAQGTSPAAQSALAAPPASAAKRPLAVEATSERFATVRVLPEKEGPQASVHTFMAPAPADPPVATGPAHGQPSLAAPAPATPVPHTPARRGGGEFESEGENLQPGTPRGGRLRGGIAPRGIGRMADEPSDSASQASTMITEPQAEVAESAGSGDAAATGPAPSAQRKGAPSSAPNGALPADIRPHGSIPQGREAEVEVRLLPSQTARQAEALVTLPAGLQFTTRAFEKSRVEWRGPVEQGAELPLRFTVSGARNGLWPVDIVLRKPDGTKLDALTVKLIVTP